MKRLLIIFALGLVCADCSAPETVVRTPIHERKAIRPEIEVATRRMINLWRLNYRAMSLHDQKAFQADRFYAEYRALLTRDDERIAFDALSKLPEMQSFFDQSQRAIAQFYSELSTGRTQTSFWDESEILTQPLKGWLKSMKVDFEYAIATMENASNYDISLALMNVAWTYADWVLDDPALTENEKNQFLAMVETVTQAIPSIVEEMRSVLEPESRVMFNWGRFGRKLGNVVLHMAIGAVVVGLVAAAISLTGGAALLQPLIIHIGQLTIEAVAASMVWGGAAGLLVGTAASLANSCLVIPTDPTTGQVNFENTHYESCG